MGKLIDMMEEAHDVLQEKQARTDDLKEPSVDQVGDWVWMVSYRRHREQAAKLQSKFMGPYCVIEVLPNHMYCVERSGHVSV